MQLEELNFNLYTSLFTLLFHSRLTLGFFCDIITRYAAKPHCVQFDNISSRRGRNE